ncbi:hypothetical protein L6452_32274 [Arctium lappa]|uniref:Uncharacterized protein n=1 Tax=Arctium lappa TaxID=4217 RepID=A0ACB8Z4C9_ARCLA|nr:hypothetical protein L6452_32274 [Arctium lappa]
MEDHGRREWWKREGDHRTTENGEIGIASENGEIGNRKWEREGDHRTTENGEIGCRFCLNQSSALMVKSEVDGGKGKGIIGLLKNLYINMKKQTIHPRRPLTLNNLILSGWISTTSPSDSLPIILHFLFFSCVI